jgi:uncharacterized protein
MDQTHTLSASEVVTLESLLADLERDTGAQVVVLMVPSTAPEDIAAYANRVANAWKIGRKNIGDGVLLVVAKQDRKLRIEVAKSLEGAIPDLAARRIIDESIAPHFKQGRFADGLRSGIEHLSARIHTEALPASAATSAPPSPLASQGFNWADTSIFLFFAVPLAAGVARAIFGTALGALLVGLGTGILAYSWTHSYALASFAALLAMVWTAFRSAGPGLSSGSRSGWPGASPDSGSHHTGDSGGFSSGGGGDFGGGGASGDW